MAAMANNCCAVTTLVGAGSTQRHPIRLSGFRAALEVVKSGTPLMQRGIHLLVSTGAACCGDIFCWSCA